MVEEKAILFCSVIQGAVVRCHLERESSSSGAALGSEIKELSQIIGVQFGQPQSLGRERLIGQILSAGGSYVETKGCKLWLGSS